MAWSYMNGEGGRGAKAGVEGAVKAAGRQRGDVKGQEARQLATEVGAPDGARSLRGPISPHDPRPLHKASHLSTPHLTSPYGPLRPCIAPDHSTWRPPASPARRKRPHSGSTLRLLAI
eukprot:3494931-Rhodomonas_salina.2